ncbi:GNAT family N-acetyltransferase [Affinibrenneria salicis]|uniref:GNAT family N-acetyltransferase n=1 Tax=Affinibrenneria salicis TaxID=2590031 RepID=A0A5J5FUW2_9GAMM|nr:GNAT family N-acetyltransferase [Affinibrenneria salicis]KAA8997342.1 GNAT family N-acetyltransferase [Affinibrenneria salicis]
MMTPTILTSRLLLRPLAPEDAEPIRLQAGDPRVARWTASFTTPMSREHSVDWVNRAIDAMRAGQAITLAMTLRPSGGFIGAISLRLPERSVPFLGYWLGADHQGQGYCSEAVLAVLRYGFTQLGLEKISARCDANNHASERVMLRCGMRREQSAPLAEAVKGRQISLLTYSISLSDKPD